MTTQNWHTEFNPSKFLSRVNLSQLIEKNEAYNESMISNSNTPCIMCQKTYTRGILLNDKSFLCQHCYSEVSMISYPEKYETLRRQFIIDTEARRLAWEAFKEKFEHKSEESFMVYFGWVSIFLVFFHPVFLVLTLILLAIGYLSNYVDKVKMDEWLSRKKQWEESNSLPKEPTLKHFHDPTAELSQKDLKILKIFNHWPGYPPFWKYLRSIVINRDSNRCQVTGCPSRLELHVHHICPVADGGSHSPDNLVSLCCFHHALEPEKGHERIWGDIKTKFFTLVCAHERTNRAIEGTHQVKAHLRRLQLVTLNELRDLTKTYGFCCPHCGETKIKFLLLTRRNIIQVDCPACQKTAELPQQTTEESGSLLAEVLGVSRNKGKWKTRWDTLYEKRNSTWGTWKSSSITEKRKQHKEKVKTMKSAPICPKCKSPMKLIRPGYKDKWKTFWGCTQYIVTGCKGSRRYVPQKGE